MTTLKTNFKDGPGFDLELFPDTGLPDKWVTLTAPRGGVYSIPREKFAQAVRDLNVIVIDKADLPEVEDYTTTHILAGGAGFSRSADPDSLRREGLRCFAAAAHLEAHPPLPPKVKALAAVLRDSAARGDFEDHAAQLINSGRIDIKEAS